MKRSYARLFLATALVLAIVAAIPGGWTLRALAGTLSTDVIGMFPREVGEFAYADMKAARSRPWFSQLRDQLLPGNFRQFEQFLTSAGIDPNTQVDEMAWAIIPASKDGGEQILGVALGGFSPSATEEKLKAQKVPAVEVHGYHLYAFGSGAGSSDILFFFLDSNTAAFGNRSALEKLIDVHFGGSESLLRNEQMFPLIKEANGKGTIWAALDEHYTHLAMQQLLPQASQFPQASAIIDRLKAMEIYVQADRGVDAHFQAVCNSVDDANVLAAAAQAGVMYRRYQEAQSHPEVAKALDSVSIAPAGDRLRVEIPITEDQLNGLIKSHSFVLQM
ncbi:MAG TPA: hypothetical protein VLW83_14615 [Candidatus Acidoferrales bacterium]|nr:hypothetical protein [Candidatus Acidoferrales bacterium]